MAYCTAMAPNMVSRMLLSLLWFFILLCCCRWPVSSNPLILFSLVVFAFCSTQINLNDRCDQHWPWAISMVVDGTDCPIHEPGNFDKAWFSHKTNGPGVQWEVGSSIQYGDICWLNGPFPAETWPDEFIFWQGLAHQLQPNELVHDNRGYRNHWGHKMKFITPNVGCTEEMYRGNQVARARHQNNQWAFQAIQCA